MLVLRCLLLPVVIVLLVVMRNHVAACPVGVAIGRVLLLGLLLLMLCRGRRIAVGDAGRTTAARGVLSSVGAAVDGVVPSLLRLRGVHICLLVGRQSLRSLSDLAHLLEQPTDIVDLLLQVPG